MDFEREHVAAFLDFSGGLKAEVGGDEGEEGGLMILIAILGDQLWMKKVAW